MTASVKPDGGGLRYDKEKSRVDLFPPDAMLALGQVFRYGADKYTTKERKGDNNWLRGMPWSQVIGPLLRHTFKFMMGHKRDQESGHLHSAHMAWNALALLTYELRGLGTDDRNKLVNQEPGLGEPFAD